MSTTPTPYPNVITAVGQLYTLQFSDHTPQAPHIEFYSKTGSDVVQGQTTFLGVVPSALKPYLGL